MSSARAPVGGTVGLMVAALVIGESLIDRVYRDGELLGEAVGGSPLNVAIGLGRLGHGVDFLTRLGDDAAGRRIIDHLRSSGVRLVAGSVGAARTASARADLGTGGAVDYRFDLSWELTGTPEAAPPQVVHTGSIAAVRDPGCLAVAALVDTYRLSATVSLDPNVRPEFITDAGLARERLIRLVERADLVTASTEDLRWIAPDREPDDVAASWLARGPAVVVLTDGARGAVGFCAAGRATVSAPPVPVLDTVGAGDAFTVGFLDALAAAGLLGGDRRAALRRVDLAVLAAALRGGARCAAVTVGRRGADLPDRRALAGAPEPE